MSRELLDTGYEPWARAAIKRGDPLTLEQGAALVAMIDHLRSLLDQQDAQVRAAMVESADRNKRIADLDLEVDCQTARADWFRNRACLALGMRPDEHAGDRDLLARLEELAASR